MNAAKTHAMLMHDVQIIMVRSSVVVIQVIKAQDFYALVSNPLHYEDKTFIDVLRCSLCIELVGFHFKSMK